MSNVIKANWVTLEDDAGDIHVAPYWQLTAHRACQCPCNPVVDISEYVRGGLMLYVHCVIEYPKEFFHELLD